MIFVSIIGLSGKRGLLDKLSIDTYNEAIANVIAELRNIAGKENSKIHLISGGCAISDHIAVIIWNKIKNGELDLPIEKFTIYTHCKWEDDKYNKSKEGRDANHYHYMFSKYMKIHSLSEIKQAIDFGAIVITQTGIFNKSLRLASCDYMITMCMSNSKYLGPNTNKTFRYCHGKKIYVQYIHSD